MVRWRIAVGAGLAAAMLLTACATGPNYRDAQASMAALGPDKARVVFFRESHFVSSLARARVKIAGKTIGTVANGGAIQVDLPPGPTTITLDTPLTLRGGELIVPLQAVGGATYYIEVAGQSALAPSGYGGATGMALNTLRATEVTQFCSPDWCATIVDQNTAMPKLQKLTLETADPS